MLPLLLRSVPVPVTAEAATVTGTGTATVTAEVTPCSPNCCSFLCLLSASVPAFASRLSFTLMRSSSCTG